jgi:hypothetical protein
MTGIVLVDIYLVLSEVTVHAHPDGANQGQLRPD